MKYLIKFKDHQPIQVKRLKASGVRFKQTFKHLDVAVVDVSKKQLKVLMDDPNVETIEIDGEVQALDEYEDSWGVTQIGSRIAHEKGVKGQSVKVAVIDTGIDYNHPEFAGIYKGGYNFVNGNNDPMDDHSHGTHCAGIVAAALNKVGVVGVAPEAELYALKVLNKYGSGVWSAVVAALDWCIDNGIQITSNSYGSSTSSVILKEAFDAAWEAGILSIAAAGNLGGGEHDDTVMYPAKYESVVAVAATDKSKNRAFFSSTGPAVEISAPGENVYSTILNGAYGYKSGTSMACPHTVGTAVLVKSIFYEFDNSAIRKQLVDTAEDLGSDGRDTLYGYGLVDVISACKLDSASAMWAESIIFTSKRKSLTFEIKVICREGVVEKAAVWVDVDKDGTVSEMLETTKNDGIAKFNIRKPTVGKYTIRITAIILDNTYIWDSNKGVIEATHTHNTISAAFCNFAHTILNSIKGGQHGV